MPLTGLSLTIRRPTGSCSVIGTAQAALAYGADDIAGTVRHELIYHDVGATTPEVLSVEYIQRLIREPVERDTLYHRVERDRTGWRSAEPLTAR